MIKVFPDNQVNKSFRDIDETRNRFYSLKDIKSLLGDSSEVDQNDELLINMFDTVPEFGAPIDYIATVFASMNFKSIKYDKKGNEELVSIPEFDNLLAQPNPYQNNSDFLKTACIQYFLNGQCYINKFIGIGLRKPSYLFLLPPQYTSIVFEKMQLNSVDPNADFRTNKIIAYKLKYGYSFEKNIDINDIIHIKDSQVNFDDGKYAKGSSRGYKAIMAAKSLKAGYEAKYVIYHNRGMMGFFKNNDPDGHLMDNKEKNRLLDTLKNKFGLRQGQYLFDYINHNIDYVNVDIDFAGLRINENNEADFRSVCKALKFPPSLLSDNRVALLRDAPAQGKKLYNDVVLPFAIDFWEKMSIGLGLAEQGIWYVPDISNIDILQEDMEKKLRINSTITENISKILINFNTENLSYNQAFYLLVNKWNLEEKEASNLLVKPKQNEG